MLFVWERNLFTIEANSYFSPKSKEKTNIKYMNAKTEPTLETKIKKITSSFFILITLT